MHVSVKTVSDHCFQVVSLAAILYLLLQKLWSYHLRSNHGGHCRLHVQGSGHGGHASHVDSGREEVGVGRGRIILERAELVLLVLQLLVAQRLLLLLAILLCFMRAAMSTKNILA